MIGFFIPYFWIPAHEQRTALDERNIWSVGSISVYHLYQINLLSTTEAELDQADYPAQLQGVQSVSHTQGLQRTSIKITSLE